MHPTLYIISGSFMGSDFERAAVQHLANVDTRKRPLINRALNAVDRLERLGKLTEALFVDMRFGFVIGRKMFKDQSWATGVKS